MSERKVALVTGSRGIGKSCAFGLALDGFDVAVTYSRHADDAHELVQQLTSHGVRAVAYEAQLGDAGAPAKLIEQVLADFDRLDVLVNNAGIAPVKPIDEITIEEWDEVLNVNLRAAFFCAQRAFVHMRDSVRGGRLIFMSSQAGQGGGVFVGAHYVASKAALIGLTKSFAKIGAQHGILSNCVSPGQIDTPLTDSFPRDKVEQLTKQIPLGRMGTADEVASAVRFLASEASSYITGATLPVNGGVYMS
jgi:3-oxoacyl-[acyl-carrier protein] reductase